MIDTIIFDLGGVLIDWNPRYLYRKLFDTEEEIDAFLHNVATMEWNEEQDGGRTLEEGTQVLLKKYPEQAIAIKAFYGRWTEMLGGPIYETVKILKAIKEDGNYRLLALTNWSSETFPIAIEQYEFLSWFEGILVSGVEKLKKPDPRIYQLMLSRFQIDPSKALFIDDNLRNVEAARNCGIKSIHFRTSSELIEELVALNVLN